MFILITVAILLGTALILLVLRFASPAFRYNWLIAAGGALLAWISVFVWQIRIPIALQFPAWQPALLFSQSPTFVGDDIAWTFALSLATLCLAIILTAVVRSNFPLSINWIGTLILTSLGILAVVADNPLTLVLIWAAIDISELVAQMRVAENPQLSERAVIAFASRAAGILVLLWAGMVSIANGRQLDFREVLPEAGLYLIIAAGLRMGVLASLAAIYGGWMWLRAPDELNGRVYWLIGMGSLAVAAALRANPLGAAAWGCATVLAGGALFLSSEQNRWLLHALFVGAWGISSLPFSLTAAGWNS